MFAANDELQPCSSYIVPNPSKIHELPEKISRKICNSQVIISLASACRELVDNALDAGATNIDIRANENGTEMLEVIDNGSGISPDNFDRLCKPHCTSKLTKFKDFNSLTSYGFRGEALNALAALSDVQILTRDAESRCAWRLNFGRNGDILESEQCSRQRGTTIRISHLFKLFPVRRQELVRSARREFLKLVECVQAFALSRPECRFSCSNTVNGKRSQLLSSPGGNAMLREVVGNLFGGMIGKGGLLEIEEAMPSKELEALYGISAHSHRDSAMEEKIYGHIKLSGFISSCEPGQGRGSSDRQYLFINRRHIEHRKICRIANDVYSLYNRAQYCTLVLFIDVPPATVDVNVCPDKRTVFLHNERELFAKFRASLLATLGKLQGKCPPAIANGQSKRKPMSTILQWRDTKLKERDGAAKENEAGDRNEGETVNGSAALNQSLIIPTASPKIIADANNYLSFRHGASNSAVNSTLLNTEDDEEEEEENRNIAIISTEGGGCELLIGERNGNEDEGWRDEPHQRGRASSHSPADLIGGDDATDNESVFDSGSFNPNDSHNLRDSFVLAESTPIVYPHSGSRGRSSANFDGITPIRPKQPHSQEFQPAKALFNAQVDMHMHEMESRYRSRSTQPTGFVTAATLFQMASIPKDKSTDKNEHHNDNTMAEPLQIGPTSSGHLSSALHQNERRHKEDNPLQHNSIGDMMDNKEREEVATNKTPKTGKIQPVNETKGQKTPMRRHCSAAKSLEAFSFQYLRQPGGIAAILREQSQGAIGKTGLNNKEGDKAKIPMEKRTPQQRRNVSIAFSSPSSSACASPSLLSPTSSTFENTLPGTPSTTSASTSRRRITAIDMEELERRFLLRKRKMPKNREEQDGQGQQQPAIKEANLDFDEKNADMLKREIERKLSLMLRKSDFAKMQLVGQFNNAFIITRLGSQVFMIDQHAADEKFNFECFQERTTIKSQELIEAQNLQLGSVNAALLKDNLELFRKNGFEFRFGNDRADRNDQAGMEGIEGPIDEMDNSNGIVHLISVPNIGGYHFNKHDIDELLSLVAEMPDQLHRPKKIRSIFASRACRKSVMFGHALTESKMMDIIMNMGKMEAPWNCPHGRPTIRHLCTIHTSK